MSKIKAALLPRLKALVAGIGTAAAASVGQYLAANDHFDWGALERSVASGVVVFILTHQTPNKPAGADQ